MCRRFLTQEEHDKEERERIKYFTNPKIKGEDLFLFWPPQKSPSIILPKGSRITRPRPTKAVRPWETIRAEFINEVEKEPWWKGDKAAVTNHVKEIIKFYEKAIEKPKTECSCPTLLNGHWAECPVKSGGGT